VTVQPEEHVVADREDDVVVTACDLVLVENRVDPEEPPVEGGAHRQVANRDRDVTEVREVGHFAVRLRRRALLRTDRPIGPAPGRGRPVVATVSTYRRTETGPCRIHAVGTAVVPQSRKDRSQYISTVTSSDRFAITNVTPHLTEPFELVKAGLKKRGPPPRGTAPAATPGVVGARVRRAPSAAGSSTDAVRSPREARSRARRRRPKCRSSKGSGMSMTG